MLLFKSLLLLLVNVICACSWRLGEGAGSLGARVAQVLGATVWVLEMNTKFLGVQRFAAVEPLIPAFGQWRQGDL